MLCILRVTPLVCSSYSSFAFFSSWCERICKLFTHTLVLQDSPLASPREPQTTHLLIVGLDYCVMCFAYVLHMHHQNLVPLSCLYTEPFELDVKIIFYYCATPPCHEIDVFKRPFRGSCMRASIMLLCCSLASSSFIPTKSPFLSDDHLNSRM